MNTYEEASAERNGAAKTLAKNLARRLRKEFPGRKVRVTGSYDETDRVVWLDVFPKDYKSESAYGHVTLIVLDKKSYRCDLTTVPERLKLDTGYGGTHATYKLKDGAVSTKTMTKLLSRVRSFVEEKVAQDRRTTDSKREELVLANLAVHHMTVAGYKCTKVAQQYGHGANFRATKEGTEVEVETSGGNKVKVALYLSTDHSWCRVEMAPNFCDELVRHDRTMETLRGEEEVRS